MLKTISPTRLKPNFCWLKILRMSQLKRLWPSIDFHIPCIHISYNTKIARPPARCFRKRRRNNIAKNTSGLEMIFVLSQLPILITPMLLIWHVRTWVISPISTMTKEVIMPLSVPTPRKISLKPSNSLDKLRFGDWD